MMRQLGKNRLFREGIWVAFGQVISAAGVLFGIRILTEFLPPDVFGEVILYTGIIAFLIGVAVNPLLQAVFIYYPNCSNQVGREIYLKSTAKRTLTRMVMVSGGLFLAVWVIYSLSSGTNLWLGPLIVLLFAVEAKRQMGLSFLNAARRQRKYALWHVTEAWSRPLAVVVILLITGPKVISVLAAYIFISLITVVLFSDISNGELKERKSLRAMFFGNHFSPLNGNSSILKKELWAYAAPLIPAGVLGWANGQADRYLIAGLIGVGQAGLYAAVYGLVSRPFLLVGGLIENTLRPAYYQALAEGEADDEKRIFLYWISLVFIVGLLGYTFFFIFHKTAAWLLLANQYRGASWMMPWFAAGHSLLIISHVFNRVCYAYGDTRAVLAGEISTAGIGLIATWQLVSHFGLAGAAYAVPLYYGVHLVTMSLFAHRAGMRGWRARIVEDIFPDEI